MMTSLVELAKSDVIQSEEIDKMIESMFQDADCQSKEV